MTFRLPIVMAEEQGADAGASAGAAATAPEAAQAKQADAQLGTPELRERLAAAKEKRTSQVGELQKALEDQAKETAALKKQIEDLSTARVKEKQDADGAQKKTKILGALVNAKVLPQYRELVLPKLEGIDTSVEGWEAKVDEFVGKHTEIVERTQRPVVKSDWAKTTSQALGERANRTMLGAMSAEQVAELHNRGNA